MGGAVGGGSTGDAPQMRWRCGVGHGRPPCYDTAVGPGSNSNGGGARSSNGASPHGAGGEAVCAAKAMESAACLLASRMIQAE
jgi:hypothetical protein